MPNVTFNAITSADNTADNFIATVISTNFNNIATVVNSGGLDSVNYGLSSALTSNTDGDAIMSSNVSHNQIVSQHLSNSLAASQKFGDSAVMSKHFADGAVVPAKLNSGCVQAPNIDYNSGDNGVRMLQIGETPEGAGGVVAARITHSFGFTLTNPDTVVATISWANAIDGDPGFTAPPTFCAEPIADVAGTAAAPIPFWFNVFAIDSISCQMAMFHSGATGDNTSTLNFHVQGPVSAT
jgi:hypothetical protein